MKRKSLNEIFRNYFYGRVPSSHYINCENLLLQIENYKDNKTNKYNIEPNNALESIKHLKLDASINYYIIEHH